MTDKRIIRLSSVAIFAVLLLALLIPFEESSRIIAATLLVPIAVIVPIVLKKRGILSINKDQVLMLMSVIALVYLSLYYISGTKFGFFRTSYTPSAKNIFTNLLPMAAIITATEIIRYVFMAQKGRFAKLTCYFSCVIAEVLIVANVPAIKTFPMFMSVVAGALFPALVANILYSYLSVRYGLYPNLVYRLLTTLYLYAIPVRSGISEALLIFFRILIPIAIYMFIDALYEKKKRLALGNTSRVWRVASASLTIVLVGFLTATVMLISNQFHYGALVIVTDSMTGEINRGDVVIYEEYDGEPITEGQVIVFEKDDRVIVHRVVDIEIINGSARYYTKGDVNENPDSGYITKSDVVGFARERLPYFGYPTLWLRSLFR